MLLLVRESQRPNRCSAYGWYKKKQGVRKGIAYGIGGPGKGLWQGGYQGS